MVISFPVKSMIVKGKLILYFAQTKGISSSSFPVKLSPGSTTTTDCKLSAARKVPHLFLVRKSCPLLFLFFLTQSFLLSSHGIPSYTLILHPCCRALLH